MPDCIALVQSGVSDAVWDRCTREAMCGDRFCPQHRESLDGAVMGFLDTDEYRHAQKSQREKALRPRNPEASGRRRKRKSPNHARSAQIQVRRGDSTIHDFLDGFFSH